MLEGAAELADALAGRYASLMPAPPVRDLEADRALDAAHERLAGPTAPADQLALDLRAA